MKTMYMKIVAVFLLLPTVAFAETEIFSSSVLNSTGCTTAHEFVLDDENNMSWNRSENCNGTIMSEDQTVFSGISVKTWFYILSKAEDTQGDVDTTDELFKWDNDIVVSLVKADENSYILELDKNSTIGAFSPLRMTVSASGSLEGDTSEVLTLLQDTYKDNLLAKQN